MNCHRSGGCASRDGEGEVGADRKPIIFSLHQTKSQFFQEIPALARLLELLRHLLIGDRALGHFLRRGRGRSGPGWVSRLHRARRGRAWHWGRGSGRLIVGRRNWKRTRSSSVPSVITSPTFRMSCVIGLPLTLTPDCAPKSQTRTRAFFQDHAAMQRVDARVAQDDVAVLGAADDVAALGRIGKAEPARQQRRVGAFQRNGVVLEHRLARRSSCWRGPRARGPGRSPPGPSPPAPRVPANSPRKAAKRPPS